MTALQSLLTGLFDYAGLYPPTALSLQSAANNYLDYSRGNDATALGRFIINADRLSELRSAVGVSLKYFRLSVILSDSNASDAILHEIGAGAPIESIEIRLTQMETMEAIATKLPQALVTYVEVPFGSAGVAALDGISRFGMRGKIRMGGVVADSFPSISDVVRMLNSLMNAKVPFKATAGLHHPIRSIQPLTYEQQSAKGTMHGFINLCCAAAVLHFGGAESDAEAVLKEEDATAWRLTPDKMHWRHLSWTREQLSTLRREFFISIGSCSFKEPIWDLRSMGWL